MIIACFIEKVHKYYNGTLGMYDIFLDLSSEWVTKI